MKVGDVIINGYASIENPSRKTIITDIGGKYIKAMYFYKGKVNFANYYKSDLIKNEKFKIIEDDRILKILKEI